MFLQRQFLKKIVTMEGSNDAASDKLQQMQDELCKLELEEVGPVITNLV